MYHPIEKMMPNFNKPHKWLPFTLNLLPLHAGKNETNLYRQSFNEK